MLDKFLKAKPIYNNQFISDMNRSFFFICQINLDKEGFINLTANNIYRLFDNGKFIGYGPARASHDYYRIDQYHLLPGQHYLLIEVSGYNCNTYYVLNTLPFFQAEIISENKVLAYTGKDFRMYINSSRYQKVTRFSFQRAFSESYHFDFDNLDFYTGKILPYKEVSINILPSKNYLPRNVDYPLLDKEAFNFLESGNIEYNQAIKPYDDRYMHLKFLKIFDKSDYEVDPNDYISRLIFHKNNQYNKELLSNQYLTYGLDNSKTGFIEFDLICYEDSNIYFIFDELNNDVTNNQILIYFYRNTTHNIVSYELKKGHHYHISFEPYTIKYLSLILQKGHIFVNHINLIKYENPLINKIKYQFQDQRINKIMDAAVATFAQNAVDVLTDCPSRERAGWLCDSYFSGQSEQLITGENKVEHNFLENYALCPQFKNLPLNMIPMCYPSECPNGVFIPNWAMFYVIELESYLRRTNDEALIKKSLDKVKGLLSYFSNFENEYGLLENLENWIMIEWSKANDPEYIKGVNLPSNMLYKKMLESASFLLNDNNLLLKANKIKTYILENCRQDNFFVDNLLRDKDNNLLKTSNISETCQYYAFNFLLDKEEDESLFNLLVEKFGPNRDYEKVYPKICKSNVFIGDYLRLIILLKNGYNQKVYDETISYFYKMATVTGTLWEHDSTFASLNHGFASYILNIIIYATFGIKDIDFSNKTIYLNSTPLKIKAEVSFNIKNNCLNFKNDNGVIRITQKNNEFKIIY